jgi:large repetitive protein
MVASHRHSSLRRRGVVLVVILGMLGLLALIGVTFATFSGQAKINARNFAQAQNFPDSSEVMDFALAQLVDDTSNPQSAIRGHSLRRDMYGNDTTTNGFLAARPDNVPMPPGGNSLFFITGMQDDPTPNSNLVMLRTNIPAQDPAFYGYNFTRWIMRVTNPQGAPPVTQTLEILRDDNTGQSPFTEGMRVFYVMNFTSPPNPRVGFDTLTHIHNPNTTPTDVYLAPPLNPQTGFTTPLFPFTLDGRYLYAFNGPGMEGMGVAVNPTNFVPGMSRYANFRVNGNLLTQGPQTGVAPGWGDPNQICGMDEDYDACDLENWFLALQSADGQVIIPSFHRPGILTALDWTYTYPNDGVLGTQAMAKILRPRAIDHAPNNMFPDLTPDPNTGKITYDVDNDGDGVTDSVWLDLGYPSRRDPEGHLFKPLFAFLIIGLNGRLPLNTAGNLALRDKFGNNLFDHAAHLGNSPSEIDLRYALQNANASGYAQVDNAGLSTPGDSPIPVWLTQLRNILTGTRPQVQDPTKQSPTLNGEGNTVGMGFDLSGTQRVYYLANNVFDSADFPDPNAPPGAPYVTRLTPSVPGRWGEGDAVPGDPNATPPGLQRVKSLPPASTPAYNFHNYIRAGQSGFFGYNQTLALNTFRETDDDDFDAFDPWPPYPPPPAPPPNNRVGEDNDSDLYDGAGAFLLPVERSRRWVTPVDIAGDGMVKPWGDLPNSYGPDQWGRVSFFRYFRPAGLPLAIDSTAVPPNGDTTKSLPGGTAADTTNNPTHGYESFRNPDYSKITPTPLDPRLFGGALYNMSNANTPTYDLSVNAGAVVLSGTSTSANVPFASAALNHANEMNLYAPNWTDAPFGPGDLEWLYRQQDSDGASLQSRLAQLAPISFTNDVDGQRRRRLFALDAWEPNRYTWAFDNPMNVFPNNSRSVGLNGLSFVSMNPNVNTPNDTLTRDLTGSEYTGTPTPQLAHLGRKINLNFPFPVSNNPQESVRLKWISDTYQALKAILPPKAVDTAEELAQLSQFVINIVDFRDPDGAITTWTNPDVRVFPAKMTSAAMATPVTYDPPKLVIADPGNMASTQPLVQYGMEYCPIAINEVLAYSFVYKDTTQNPEYQETKRLMIELVNTLTDPVPTGGANSVSWLDISNWQMVILPDDPSGRPDPYTGQIPVPDPSNNPPTRPRPVPISNTNTGAPPAEVTTPSPVVLPALQSKTGAAGTVDAATNYYYVIGNNPPTSSAEKNPPTLSASLNNDHPLLYDGKDTTKPPYGAIMLPKFTATPDKAPDATTNPPIAAYYWLYLLRPANPFDPKAKLFDPKSPLVVVDSMRFPYSEAGGYVTFDTTTGKYKVGKVGTQPLYSVQRLQPYRGGHAVPATTPSATTPFLPGDAYGYTEQTAPAPPPTPPATSDTTVGQYGGQRITANIYHTLGKVNYPADPVWDYLPFHDRDFTSVAELLMVPGCPPGLFTKKFVELPPSPTFPASTRNPVPPPTAPTAPAAFTAAPRTYPYLVDNFYYTATTEYKPPQWPATTTPPTPPYVGGPSGAGWFKMFEIFEVPSPVIGAIGLVAQGENFDWMRQDLRPGLLNLNLIIDEEVFFGLMSESGLQLGNSSGTRLNTAQLAGMVTGQATTGPAVTPPTGAQTPAIVTQINQSGAPNAVYPMPNLGFSDTAPGAGTPTAFMKAAFSDFLKLRSGGSGFLFAYGQGVTGDPSSAGTGMVAMERPFHALTYPDIDFTVMRPAALPPSPATNVTPNPPGAPSTWPSAPTGNVIMDPGQKNPYLYVQPPGTSSTPIQPPPIPARRLFQIPDDQGSLNNTTNPNPPDNASDQGDPRVNQQTTNAFLANPTANLALPIITAPTAIDYYLGVASNNDRRDHPFFRTEWLQKIMNLTTVRTHQFAVWITVGFFEVTRQGTPLMATINPSLAYDQLGLELGVLSGRNTRYRSFFLLDRTKAVGFNPSLPGDFRSVVVYRQKIE